VKLCLKTTGNITIKITITCRKITEFITPKVKIVARRWLLTGETAVDFMTQVTSCCPLQGQTT
jgi:hypothetical protein